MYTYSITCICTCRWYKFNTSIINFISYQQGELQVVQQEMDRHHNWMVQAALKIQNIREQKKTEQRKIDSVCV